MARIAPRVAPLDWLSNATMKLKKSIFRTVEFKHKQKFNDLMKLIQSLEDEVQRLGSEETKKDARIVELERMLAPFTNPEVAVKNVEKVVYQVLPSIQNVKEDHKKRKMDRRSEINEMENLKHNPPSKILKIGPAPRTIQPPPGKPKKKLMNEPRGRSNSPKPKPDQPISSPSFLEKGFLKRDRSTSPLPQLTPLVYRREGKWKKRKKEKEDRVKKKL